MLVIKLVIIKFTFENSQERGMRLFSQKPVKGIKFFHENGLVEDSMEAIAKFLHAESDRLDKTAIGNHNAF
jgi:hypothetical protein